MVAPNNRPTAMTAVAVAHLSDRSCIPDLLWKLAVYLPSIIPANMGDVKLISAAT
jgi:hypothetical protein